MKAGIYPMTNGEKNFLKFFDAKKEIYVNDGELREEISEYNERIFFYFFNNIVHHETMLGDGVIWALDVFKIGENRFFKIEYVRSGKDFADYSNFSYPVEVKPVIVSKTVYEEV